MKTLYISDLDGTLLNSDATLSLYSQETINKLYANNINFTVATARTGSTVLKMFSGVTLNTPIILMNGVCIFDTQKNEYIKVNYIQKNALADVYFALKKYNITGFLYTISDNTVDTYYENLDSPHRKNFHDERVAKYKKSFTKIESFNNIEKDVVYFSVCDLQENLIEFYNSLKDNKYLHTEFYRDIYLKDYWYLEICSNTASKYNGIIYLKENYGFSRVVSFGDNLNDISMFLASDESFAVANAKDEVKLKASGVILSNNQDGVCRWLEENCLSNTKNLS